MNLTDASVSVSEPKTSSPSRLVFFLKEFAIVPGLTVEQLSKHANGYVRYNNVNDLIHSGDGAIRWFLDRVNVLFRINLSGAPEGGLSLDLAYMSVFCRSAAERDDQSFPLYDFIKFTVRESGQTGYGAMFSSQMREYYRDKLEKTYDVSEIPVDQAFFRSVFRADSPETGVLETYPLIMLPRGSGGASLTNQYMLNIGFQSEGLTPRASKLPFRYYYKGDLADIDPVSFAAISSVGQAIFEIARPNLYPIEDQGKPTLDWQHFADVKWSQHAGARKWVGDHGEEVRDLISLHGLSLPPELY